jgi:hypothetical protein
LHCPWPGLARCLGHRAIYQMPRPSSPQMHWTASATPVESQQLLALSAPWRKEPSGTPDGIIFVECFAVPFLSGCVRKTGVVFHCNRPEAEKCWCYLSASLAVSLSSQPAEGPSTQGSSPMVDNRVGIGNSR